MTTPYYSDEAVALYHGDCLDVLRELPDASVDAVVTDPPYGLEFMGRGWDAPWQETDVNADAGLSTTGYTDGARRLERPSFTGSTNPKCLDCKGTRRGRRDGTAVVPVCMCSDGGRFPNVRAIEMRAFQDWCRLWATECLRVLKPGGHLLAFGGSRTWHRLACAVEDAGFEVRDSIAWLYGSGFPKSLDVSKAIDKAAHVNDETHRRIALVAEVIRTHREAKGMERAAVSEAVVGTRSGACWNWEHQQLPSAEMWPAIKRILDIPDEFDGLIEGTRAQFIGAERAVIGQRKTGIGTGRGAVAYIADSENRDITAPATPDAERWQGWGTALKPSHEPVVVARKPHSTQGILATIGSHLDTLETAWQAPEVDPTTPTGAAEGSPAQTATSPSELATATSSSTVTSWRRCWVELCELTSTSTTATTSETTTALTTLSSSLSKLTAESTQALATSPHGSTSLATAVDNLFASVVCGLRATLALSATAPAIASTPRSLLDAGGSSPAFEPVVVARKPLIGTVSANVLAHGTGALNIDGCRVGAVARPLRQSLGDMPARGIYGEGLHGSRAIGVTSEGRWPPNVVLDASQAAELDQQTGTTTSRVGRPRGAASGAGWGMTATGTEYDDSGGPSRFFPTFRYEAKAPTSERPRAGGVAHPTVKPLDLMRWLVRLVTPPGGVVLEPFAGSGTTAEACVLEGLRCIAIEREADYLPLIVQRLTKPLQPGLDLGGTA